MPLSSGEQLGHYKIQSLIGKGGMGEVYRAFDTKLERDVAVKVLPAIFAGDSERLARFEREAKVLASLNHSGIASIYGVEERALVMELVPGPTLADRIKQGPIPVDETVDILLQMADALEYAHERGVIHRDLKPANIKIDPEGKVKLLDFGLAKALSDPTSSDGDPANSPTLTMGATLAGTILGTAAYMAPEQARGRKVDRRADIWAFGVVLWEMLTGERLFQGEDNVQVLSRVLEQKPDLECVPEKFRKLLGRCLDRNAKDRLRDIGEARFLLQSPAEGAAAPTQPTSPPPRLRWLWPTVAALASIATASLGIIAYHATRPAELKPLVRLNVDLGPDVSLSPLQVSADVILSPDGNRLAFVSKGSLFTRRLNQPNATELAGTDGVSQPFFSPDGQWVAFFAQGKLKKISVDGGGIVTLCDAPLPHGGSWGEDGYIIAALNSPGSGLSRVPSGGGAPAPLTELAPGESTQRWPKILPGGKAVLFTSHNATTNFDAATIEILSLRDHQRKTLWKRGTFGRYLATSERTGHLVYINNGTLFAVPFDPDKLELLGTPSPVLEDVAYATGAGGAAQLAFSENGTLVYRSGGTRSQTLPLQWLDAAGKVQILPVKPGLFSQPVVSPDGKMLALTVNSGSASAIWTYDTQRDALARLTFGDERYSFPVWSPDGRYIAFHANAGGIYWTRSDGAGKPQPLIETKTNQYPWSFSPDGKRIAFAETTQQRQLDLMTAPVEDSGGGLRAGKPEGYLQTEANELYPAFSPDGRWIAYRSFESGTSEIYVRSFPDHGGKWLISTNAGYSAAWSPNGRELFYRTEDQRIMVVTYTTKGNSFLPDKPRLWSDKRLTDTGIGRNFDVAPDGKRLLVLMAAETSEAQQNQNHVIFLENFFDELRRRAPPSGK